MYIHPSFSLPFVLERFLDTLGKEIYNAASPIWREDFNQTQEALTVQSPAGSSETSSHSPDGSSSIPAGPDSVPMESGKLSAVTVINPWYTCTRGL